MPRYYKIVAPSGSGIPADWAGTQADATKARMAMVEANSGLVKKSQIEIKETEVPADKQGLLQFLKDNVKA